MGGPGGTEPHTAKLRARFEALNATKRKAAVRAARAELEGGATRAAAWNTAMAEVAPVPAKAAPKARAAPKPVPAFRGKAVKEGDALGTRTALPAWCDGCKAA